MVTIHTFLVVPSRKSVLLDLVNVLDSDLELAWVELGSTICTRIRLKFSKCSANLNFNLKQT
jgi:hypothetical protein